MSSRTRRIPHLLVTGVLMLGIPCAHAADTPPSQDPPFTHYIGDRLYVRGYFYLHCIGEKRS
jgi:hypothetical protein